MNSISCLQKHTISSSALETAAPLERKQMLEKMLQEMVQKGEIAKAPAVLKKLSSKIFSLDSTTHWQEQLIKEAKIYKSLSVKNPSSSAISSNVVSFLEGLMSTFGMRDIFQPAENAVEQSMFKSQKLFSLMFLLVTAGPVMGMSTLGSFIAGISALDFLWPMLRPMPHYIPPGAEYWSSQDHRTSGYGRKESLDGIAQILKMNRHAILVGPSRVGKSLTARAFKCI